jgi:hypothetical protein
MEEAMSPGVFSRLRKEALAERPHDAWELVADELLADLKKVVRGR